MMWHVNGTALLPNTVDFTPIETLDEYDFPRLFTCKDTLGSLHLAYNCGDDADGYRFVVVSCDDDLVSRLVNGQISLRDAISRENVWIFDLDNEWNPVRSWLVPLDALPNDALPRPGAMLYLSQHTPDAH